MQRRKCALVTGSTSGIGLAIAAELASRGTNLVLNGFGEADEIEALRARIAKTHGVDVLYDSVDMRPASPRPWRWKWQRSASRPIPSAPAMC